MYNHNEISHVHFEPTQKCQALCPMCDRTHNLHIKNAELSIEQFKNIIDSDFAKQLNSFLMCGNHGDPMIAKDTLDMYEWLRYNNSKLYLHMTTNGGGRSDDWWKNIAKVFGNNGRVTFSVDGLEDTNHLYRVNVNWKKVENSMDVFTQAGGKGIWVFLIFKHNEHQVEEAERMAKLFGLEFIKKKTGRWVQSYKGDKIKKKETLKGNEIKPPTKQEYQNKSVNDYENLIDKFGNFDSYLDSTMIKCKSLDTKEIYISAEGLVTPCCWTAGKLYKAYESLGQNQMWSYLNNELQSINALHKPLRDIIEGPFFKNIEKSWNLSSCSQGKSKVCAEKCGTGFDAFGDQWK